MASCLSVTRGDFLRDDFCREHAVCPLSRIEKHPLMGGYLYTSAIVFSIGATAGVLYNEVVRWWEGPLWEVPLYTYVFFTMNARFNMCGVR